MSKRSRLTKKFEKRSKQTLILSCIGIILLMFIILRYGIPLASDITFNIGQVVNSLLGRDDEDTTEVVEDFIPIPNLDSLPEATKEKEISVTGNSLEGLEIELFVDGSKVESTKVDSDGEFSFAVSLSEGTNIIKVRAVKGEKEGEFSDTEEVAYDNKPPELTIESPGNGDTTNSNPVRVAGKTEQDVNVTVNGFVAIISGESFSYNLALKEGGNEVKVVATDAAGNTTEKTININYSP